MNRLFYAVLLSLAALTLRAQSPLYTTANAHAHNDYLNKMPFFTAYYETFGSIEADVFEKKGQLYVAHTASEIDSSRTLERLYLQPLLQQLQQYKGYPYADSSRSLQLMIDFKTGGVATMKALVQQLERYPAITQSGKVQVVISGDQPATAQWAEYPGYILFDGKVKEAYTPAQLARIPMFSANLRDYTNWNGKGVIIHKEKSLVEQAIADVHAKGKRMRFWGAPDNINTWKTMVNMGVDYIGTDHIAALSSFLSSRAASEYRSGKDTHAIYTARYVNNDQRTAVKNVILLIGDGMGLTQIYSGLTANRGQLNLLQMINIGFSKTYSADNYITDSAAGGTAMASGQKTNNRAIGVDATGVAHPAIPDLIAPFRMKSALISAGDITDATPAAFYGHQPDRGMQQAIANDFLKSPVSIMIGGGPKYFAPLAGQLQKQGYTIVNHYADMDSIRADQYLVLDDQNSRSMQQGRGNFLTHSIEKAISSMRKNPAGFFLMAEGAQIDIGGHVNNVSYMASEMVDFDAAIGAAMRFADEDGKTLVIVTADHETGGLSLLDGDIRQGYIDGHFSTNDHSAVMVPVFAYGPHSLDFRGVYENTDIFRRIMEVLRRYHASKK